MYDLSPSALQIGKNRFHKSHAFDYRADVPVFVGESKPGIGECGPTHPPPPHDPTPSQEASGCWGRRPRATQVFTRKALEVTSQHGLHLTDRCVCVCVCVLSTTASVLLPRFFVSTPTSKKLSMRNERKSIASGVAPSTSTWRMTPSRSMSLTLPTQASRKVSRPPAASPPVLPPSPGRHAHQAPQDPSACAPRLPVLHCGELQCWGEDRSVRQAVSDHGEPHTINPHTLILTLLPPGLR